MRVVRIFVSSPNDAMAERRRVSRVVERLNAALADTARLEAVRWEERFYAAHDGFQPQIPRSGECDIVLAVLRGRIGSPLSAAFHQALPPEEQLPDGGTYASGTAYEIVSAIRARQQALRGDSPDVYIFRWPNPPQVSLDAPDRADIEAQWLALKRFTDAVFLTAEGQFKGAYQTYASLDDFEAQAEALLRDWLKRHVLGDRTVLWPAERGSPFRGLQPFGMKHAAVFFGRGREIARAAERLKASAAAGLPFQLVIGPSGAGKSSFLRAGLVPRLLSPGEVEGVGTWRMVLMRPGESPEGPVAALARRLFEPASAIDPAEAGRPEALPELAQGAFATPEALARQLAHADETSAAPILEALDRVAQAAGQAWGSDRPEPARLLLVVDQLDEIFATTIGDEQRATFARLLETLARSGAVWVVASLRAEFYEVFLKSPLAVLAGDERTLTLKAPGLAEMAEIVREPARAADLDWETDPETKERLDERLLADIDRPDLLPLLQFVLDRLYEKREGDGGAPTRLTFSAYRALGTLDGAIRQEAERAFGRLGPAEQAALPRLLRGLVVPAQGSGAAEAAAFALVPAPLAAVAPTEAGRRLAAALVDARLLSSGQGEDGQATVGLAHQRVIEAWDRARAIVAESAGFHRVRAGIGGRRRDWEVAKRPNDLLLPRGVFLAQAEEIAGTYGDEIAPEDLAYLQASRHHAGRALRRAYAAAVLFAAVAVAAVAAGVIAYQQRQQAEAQRQIAEAEQQRAERNFTLARKTVDQVITDVAGGLRNVEGMRVETVRRILTGVEATMGQLTQEAPNQPKIESSRAAMLIEFGRTYHAAGDAPAAAKAFQDAIDIDRALLRREPDNAQWQHALSVGLGRLGFRKYWDGDVSAALAALDEAIDIDRALLRRDPDNTQWRYHLAGVLGTLADVKGRTGDIAAAKAAADEAHEQRRAASKRDPAGKTGQPSERPGVSDDAGDARPQAGPAVAPAPVESAADPKPPADAATAPESQEPVPQEATADRPPVPSDPDGTGGPTPPAGAPAALSTGDKEADPHRVETKQDRDGDGSRQTDPPTDADDDENEAKPGMRDTAAVLAALEKEVGLRRVRLKRDPDNTQLQGSLWFSLNRLGFQKLRAGDRPGALAAYEEALGLQRAMTTRDPGNTLWQHNLWFSLNRVGYVKALAGDTPAARAAYDESLAIARTLANLDPTRTLWQSGLSISLNMLGSARQQAGDAAGARAAYEESVPIARALVERDPETIRWQAIFAFGLNRLADLRLQKGDLAGALAAREELLDLSRAQVRRAPDNAGRRRNLVASLNRLGNLKKRAGDDTGARALQKEALDLRRSLDEGKAGTAQQ